MEDKKDVKYDALMKVTNEMIKELVDDAFLKAGSGEQDIKSSEMMCMKSVLDNGEREVLVDIYEELNSIHFLHGIGGDAKAKELRDIFLHIIESESDMQSYIVSKLQEKAEINNFYDTKYGYYNDSYLYDYLSLFDVGVFAEEHMNISIEENRILETAVNTVLKNAGDGEMLIRDAVDCVDAKNELIRCQKNKGIIRKEAFNYIDSEILNDYVGVEEIEH